MPSCGAADGLAHGNTAMVSSLYETQLRHRACSGWQDDRLDEYFGYAARDFRCGASRRQIGSSQCALAGTDHALGLNLSISSGNSPLHHTRFAPNPSNNRSEEHTSELPSLMRTSYAVFCLKKN